MADRYFTGQSRLINNETPAKKKSRLPSFRRDRYQQSAYLFTVEPPSYHGQTARNSDRQKLDEKNYCNLSVMIKII